MEQVSGTAPGSQSLRPAPPYEAAQETSECWFWPARATSYILFARGELNRPDRVVGVRKLTGAEGMT